MGDGQVSAEQGEGDDGLTLRLNFVEKLLLEVVGDRHLAGGDFGGGCAGEAQFAVTEGGGIAGFGVHANRRAEDAAGHGAPFIDIAETGGRVERGTWRLVGIVLKAGAVRIGFAETASFRIARES